MSKKKTAEKPAKATVTKATTTTTFDPALTSLFASSSGPVKIPTRSVPAVSITSTNGQKRTIAESSHDQNADTETSGSESEASDGEDDTPKQTTPLRKRRKTAKDADDLESIYLSRLAQEERKELAQKEAERKAKNKTEADTSSEGPDEDEGSEDDDDDEEAEDETAEAFNEDGNTISIPLHESLQPSHPETSKNARTVFLSNVSTKAIKSKSSRTLLLSHLKTALDVKSNEKIESIRFRSTAFASSAGPKRAAYAKKELMDETAQGTNAYVVLSSEAAARKVALRLNGTTVLDRHIHADSLADPLKTDNKRCVFVGNLPFVDEETNQGVDDTNGEQPPRRSRAKLPADPEEGLWRTFAKCGKIESVRVVRDKATRVGKGFAYVQFEDGNGVEKALELDGKKFPPLLPRLLRVMRSKKVMKRDATGRGGKAGAGQGRRVNGRSGAGGRAGGEREQGGRKSPKLSGVVFEGYRASSGANKIKVKTKSRGSKPTKNSNRRAAAFRAGGGKKQRA